MEYMLEKEKLDMIRSATEDEISDMLLAIMERYREVFPHWEIHVLTIEKAVDKNKQLDQAITLIEKLKEK